MKCHQCGCQLHATAKFCLSCGVNQIRVSASSLPIPTAPLYEEKNNVILPDSSSVAVQQAASPIAETGRDSLQIAPPLIHSASVPQHPIGTPVGTGAAASLMQQIGLKKYILIGVGLVVLVGIGVGFYLLNRTKTAMPGDVAATPVLPVYPSSVATLQPYELGQAIFLFMPDLEKKAVQWNHRANEQVEWLDENYNSDHGINDKTQASRTGLLRINVLGLVSTILSGKEYELAWSVAYITKSNPKFGVEEVLIEPGYKPGSKTGYKSELCFGVNYSGCDFDIEGSLKRGGIKFEEICRRDETQIAVRAYRLNHPKREPVFLVHETNSGSGGSSSSIRLVFSNDQKNLCADSVPEPEIKAVVPAVEAKSPSLPTTVEAPVINVGDKYTYETEITDVAGKVSKSTATREVTAIDGDRVTVIVTSGKTGKARTLIYDRTWNIVETGDSSDLGMIYSPPIKYFNFPLTVEKKWSATSTETDKKTGKTRQHIVNGEVGGWDGVDVAAGTFAALVIRLHSEVNDGDKRSTGTDVSWYAPSIGRTVKTEISGQDAEGRQEKKTISLVSYQAVASNKLIASPPVLDGIRKFLIFNGQCIVFVVGNRRYQCSSIMYSVFNNGRVGFSIPTGDGALMLSGGKDSQLDATRYTLLVDRIRFGDGNVQNKYDADGKCEMRISADGAYVHKLKCQASNTVENIVIDFVGDGSPVKTVLE